MRRLELSAPAKQSTIAVDKTLTAKGASLEFVPPMVKEGKMYAPLEKSEVESLSEVWANVIILYVVRQTPSIRDVTRFIEQSKNNVAKPTISLHEKGYFLVKLALFRIEIRFYILVLI